MAYATVSDLIAAFGTQEVIALTDREERPDPNAQPDEAGSAANLAQLAARVRAERDARLTVCDCPRQVDIHEVLFLRKQAGEIQPSPTGPVNHHRTTAKAAAPWP